MRTTLKHLIVGLTLVLAAGMTLSAQHGGPDRLPRILDPLGILPTPRQVLRTLDHAARVLPPVVVAGGRHDAWEAGYGYDYDYGCDDGYGRRRVPVRYGPPPMAREYRHGGWGHRHDGRWGHEGRWGHDGRGRR